MKPGGKSYKLMLADTRRIIEVSFSLMYVYAISAAI